MWWEIEVGGKEISEKCRVKALISEEGTVKGILKVLQRRVCYSPSIDLTKKQLQSQNLKEYEKMFDHFDFGYMFLTMGWKSCFLYFNYNIFMVATIDKRNDTTILLVTPNEKIM